MNCLGFQEIKADKKQETIHYEGYSSIGNTEENDLKPARGEEKPMVREGIDTGSI